MSMDDNIIELNNRKCYRILLAEDYEVNQKLARLILQKSGYRVDGVLNGQQAVEAYKKNHYDLILMDIQMPVMDGHEATQRIRNWEGGMRNKMGENSDSNSDFRLPTSDFRRVPIIAMTGSDAEDTFDPQRYPGMDDCICKPLQRDHLLSVVERWTDPGSSCPFDQRPLNEIGTPVEKPDEKNLPLDLDRAIDEFMGNRQILYAVLAEFISQVGDQITAIRRAGSRSDYGVIASEAHRIKGGAANLAARKLSLAASDLENAAEGKKAEETDEWIEALEQEFHHLKRFLRQKGICPGLGKK